MPGADGGAEAQPRYLLEQLPDGTVRQYSPLSGTVAWTVPGRSHRPLAPDGAQPVPLGPDDHRARCAFCPARQLETPPEKARLVQVAPGAAPAGQVGPPWQILRHVGADRLGATRAEVRRIPNLFEILPLEYWQANHGYVIPEAIRARAAAYAAEPAGRAHLLGLMRTRALASGATAQEAAALADEQLLAGAVRFFDGAHDLVVARRHFVDGATHDDQLASAGDLSPDEHHAYLVMAVDALSDLHGAVPGAAYVATFQNWLRAAGASFDHLHKQLVAIDELGPLMTRILAMLDRTPDLFTVAIADPAAADRLVIAENEHAIALAGVGHRYPTVEIYSTGRANRPWEHDAAALRGVSDMLHAVHAATGRAVPTNEEWHYRPVGAAARMPWRINVKWRISTLAGFEGGTRINVNTISPADLRSRMVGALGRQRSAGRIAAMSLGDECSHRTGALAYRGG
jgi:galactose-1-phosphate uridylyltransferase